MLGEPSSLVPLRPQVQLALDRAGNVMTIEDLYTFVLTGSVQLWTTPEKPLASNATACMFTELVFYPRLRAIRSMYTAGNMRDAMGMIPRMARWALDQGCTRAEFAASPGWLRVANGKQFVIQTAFCAAPLHTLLDPSAELHTDKVIRDSRKGQDIG